VPREITVDNAKQFNCHLFKDFCYQMGVELAFAYVYHPQSNRAVEEANTLIFTTIKKILENQSKGKWAEELPRVVWSHNTSVYRATKFSPLKLLYGRIFDGDGKDKAMIISLGRQRRQGAGTLLEHRQSPPFLHLTNFVIARLCKI
jgi:hypothetical protein